ncbi:MAG: bile acid:sodium symporter [Sphingomonadales bacterium]|nr:bile acid:sodium symporter [Sphingomonadales bacterium]MBU3991984.1 bile acid:sodium symporter [Alphaproteobacteria bacterium]
MRRPLSLPRWSLPAPDPFLLWLIGVVAAASLLPVRGEVAAWFELAAKLAIALLFFLHGAKLSRAAIVAGLGNWRLHLLVLGSTYVLFPALGLATAALARGWIDPLLAAGLLFLTLLPSTVQSSIAFTALARGNVAGAVCSASLSNLLGIFLTPLLVGLLMRAGGDGAMASWSSVRTIAIQLLLPFLAGHLLRPVIGGFIDRNKAILQPVDRSSILLVVYTAFSAAVISGIWTRVGVAELGLLLALSAVILGIVMGVNALVARAAGLPREDAIVLLFCGSKKSLVSGVPMAAALFAPATVGMVVLPLMIFHQLQLFLCAWLAGRFGRELPAHPVDAAARHDAAMRRVPQGEAEAAAAAGALGIVIPAPCLPGVVANLALLGRHAAALDGGADGAAR